MNMRASLPGPIKRGVRNSYVNLGRLSAAHRIVPDFILVGGQRCGTTSLFRAFEQHPQIIRPTFNKGINYFDLNYHRGDRWYRGHFPLEINARRRTPNGLPTVAFEASGYYMFHPLAPERICRDLPDIKIIAMLRDPVERAHSAWKHESARGLDNVTFEEAIDREHERTFGERDRMILDPRYNGRAYRHYSYVARGHYAAQLREFYERLPSANIHVIYSEVFFSNPEGEFDRLTDFLGVERSPTIVFDQHNARPSGPMPGRSREKLTEIYDGEAAMLEALVGHRPPWGLPSNSRSTF